MSFLTRSEIVLIQDGESVSKSQKFSWDRKTISCPTLLSLSRSSPRSEWLRKSLWLHKTKTKNYWTQMKGTSWKVLKRRNIANICTSSHFWRNLPDHCACVDLLLFYLYITQDRKVPSQKLFLHMGNSEGNKLTWREQTDLWMEFPWNSFCKTTCWSPETFPTTTSWTMGWAERLNFLPTIVRSIYSSSLVS